jgi:polyisoprenoid-binding protein YceI
VSSAIAPGTHVLGPETATLTVKTGKAGAAAKAGHNLTIEVTAWEATLTLGADPSDATIRLTADGGSLKVREGHGGMMPLGAEETRSIEQSIDDDVLKGGTIVFTSTAVGLDPAAGGMAVTGDLELNGRRRPIAFDLSLGADGAITGSATVKQTDWGIKPYSALFGTLKVVDEVEVLITTHTTQETQEHHG